MKEFLRTIKYTLIAASAGIIQFATLALFNEVFMWTAWVSYIVSLAISVVWNLTINRKATFKSNNNYTQALLKVIGFYLVFAPLSTWWTKVLTDDGWNEYVVEVITVFINFITEFLFMRFVVFKNSIDSAITNQKEENK